eukprot:GHVT01050431.1.p2 GENE.GHVT01050431.1~~GHVT01050431.1.p2  ORF type:complete len:115 (+),score=20.04 GHVT01050431.1:382-726(+)
MGAYNQVTCRTGRRTILQCAACATTTTMSAMSSVLFDLFKTKFVPSVHTSHVHPLHRKLALLRDSVFGQPHAACRKQINVFTKQAPTVLFAKQLNDAQVPCPKCGRVQEWAHAA